MPSPGQIIMNKPIKKQSFFVTEIAISHNLEVVLHATYNVQAILLLPIDRSALIWFVWEDGMYERNLSIV